MGQALTHTPGNKIEAEMPFLRECVLEGDRHGAGGVENWQRAEKAVTFSTCDAAESPWAPLMYVSTRQNLPPARGCRLRPCFRWEHGWLSSLSLGTTGHEFSHLTPRYLSSSLRFHWLVYSFAPPHSHVWA